MRCTDLHIKTMDVADVHRRGRNAPVKPTGSEPAARNDKRQKAKGSIPKALALPEKQGKKSSRCKQPAEDEYEEESAQPEGYEYSSSSDSYSSSSCSSSSSSSSDDSSSDGSYSDSTTTDSTSDSSDSSSGEDVRRRRSKRKNKNRVKSKQLKHKSAKRLSDNLARVITYKKLPPRELSLRIRDSVLGEGDVILLTDVARRMKKSNAHLAYNVKKKYLDILTGRSSQKKKSNLLVAYPRITKALSHYLSNTIKI